MEKENVLPELRFKTGHRAASAQIHTESLPPAAFLHTMVYRKHVTGTFLHTVVYRKRVTGASAYDDMKNVLSETILQKMHSMNRNEIPLEICIPQAESPQETQKEKEKEMRNLKKNKKKGFTLVELIVVLVILAILAALLVPALTGYIDKAKQKQVIAETRQCVMAAQTLVDEKYANVNPGGGASITLSTDEYDEIKDLAEVSGTITANSITLDGDGKLTKLTYVNGKTCNYNSTATPKYDVP